MRDLPTGTVTFLFTDVEGSTRLVQAIGVERFRDVLDRHDEILRSAIATGDGTEVRTEGDSFFAAFPTATGALDAAIEAQRVLANEPWPEDAPIRVRMGLHTGEGRLGGDDYAGIDVHRAARVSSAGSGGQVLISDTTRALVESSLPAGVDLRDLGSHRLKDGEHPEHVHDLVIVGLASDFPPIRTTEVPTNLPLEPSSFVGRAEDVDSIAKLLRQNRVLTLTGPGGTGKTRLALHVGRENLGSFGDGVFFVALSSVVDPGLVPSAVAGALGVREDPTRPLVDTVADHLREREILLVLDNFEQILDAASVVDSLVTKAPRVRVLISSRAPLRIPGEQEYHVAPLALPEPETSNLAALAASEAVALFVERTKAVRPDFALTAENAPAVAGIAARLDGLPLAIELAASRSRTLAPAELLERLDRRLALLTGGARNAPDRQRTLSGAIEWSYELLQPEEQRTFARVSVFSGGWTLDAAENVCGPGLGIEVLDAIESLIDQSLVRLDVLSAERTRYRMLQTIREFASDRLRESQDETEIRRRHARQFVAMAKAAEPELLHEDRSWLDRLEQEHDNIRAALRWSIDSGDAEPGLWLAGHLWRFWQVRSHIGEGQTWVAELLVAPAAQERTAARAKALGAAGSLAYYHRDWKHVRPAYEEALAISEEIGDTRALAEACYNLSFAEILDRKAPRAKELLTRAAELYERLGDDLAAAHADAGHALVLAEEGDFDGAFEELEGALETFIGARDWWGVAFASGQRAAYALRGEDYPAARQAMLMSLDASDALEVWGWRSVAVQGFALTEILDGDAELGVQLAGAAERMVELGGGAEPPPAIIMMESPLEAAKQKLPQDRIDALFAEGRAMDPAEAIAVAHRLGSSPEDLRC
ncbi:MAG: ATP-binding protein [Actinomycetota bacterium]